MRETLEKILKRLVDEPDAVQVTAVERNGLTIIEVRVAPGDMGKVIGKQGRTVRALRSLTHLASVKQKRRFALEIVE